MDETWPNPASAYQLRGHLRDDHADDRTGAGWHELVSAHDHHHRIGADHEHEAAEVSPTRAELYPWAEVSPTRAELYPWIVRRVSTRPTLPPQPKGRRPPQIRRHLDGRCWIEGPCETCGYDPVGWRKRCPACLTVVTR